MSEICRTCQKEMITFDERISELVRMGWIVQGKVISRKEFEQSVTTNLVKTMGFDTEEHLRWVADRAEWKRYDFPLSKDSIVIDVGGYDGLWAKAIDDKYGCKIFVFEPTLEFFNEIVELHKGNPNIKVIHGALSNRDGEAIIHVQSNSSSIHQDNGGRKEEIKLIDVNKWLIENNIENVDLMKLNCEASEYEILMSMVKPENMSHLKVDNFLIQFHKFPVHYESMYEAIHNEFKHTHDVTFNYLYVWEALKRKRK